jgi:uncharacterized Zn finger protein (UPF0148 family)
MPEDEVTRRMGQLLRKGAAILDKACPTCNTPLLRLPEGMLYCAKCHVRYTEDEKGETSAPADAEAVTPMKEVLTRFTSKILLSIDRLCQSLGDKPHIEEIRQFAAVAKDLVETLRIIRNLQT